MKITLKLLIAGIALMLLGADWRSYSVVPTVTIVTTATQIPTVKAGQFAAPKTGVAVLEVYRSDEVPWVSTLEPTLVSIRTTGSPVWRLNATTNRQVVRYYEVREPGFLILDNGRRVGFVRARAATAAEVLRQWRAARAAAIQRRVQQAQMRAVIRQSGW